MVIMMIVVDGSSIVILFSMGERLLRMVGEVRHVLLILVVRVMSLMGHWVIVVTVETTMMVRAVIEVI